MAKEKNLQTLIIDDMEGRPGILIFKLMKANINGLPDLWILAPTGTFAVEVKAPGEVPKPHQEAMINRINATKGARAYFVDSWQAWSKIKSEVILT